ncbi:rhomboid-like protein 15 [Durio zibethinus]|uniref:Rhomboid-like protein 15 n=1 Tax=Durio zibethinus TaxID=66656 RepID=A0A6P5Z2F9_DURZI|nr:rhomboid-like protein 15 [Durio zibethinus]
MFNIIYGVQILQTCCVRQPKFILCSGGNPSTYILSFSGQNSPSSGLFSGNIWRNLSSWIPLRETAAQSTQDDPRFPGKGRTLGSGQNTAVNSDLNLEGRLLDNSSSNNPSDSAVAGAAEWRSKEGGHR